jgi:phosphatidylglycerol---prolipoprotein diacylglyceryl transferase
VFLVGYGLSRAIVEFYRQPDAHIGFLSGGATMGQMLSVPLFLLGIYLIWRPGPQV